MLDGYIRVKDIDDEIKPNDHVRYVTIDANGKQAFRTGGFVVCVEDKFLMLTNRSI